MKLPGWVFPAASGALFAVGLALSRMTDPAKVIGFLDVTGSWDPALGFVMIGAVGVYALLYRLIARRRTPLFDTAFHAPTSNRVDGKLMAGAAIFGAGWGVAGYCPGPGLVSLTSLPAAVFVVTMAAGFLLHHGLFASRRGRVVEGRPV